MIPITDIKIYPFETGDSSSSIKAYAEVTLDNCLTVKGIKIIETKNGGLFLGFPSRKGRDEEFHDLIIPTSSEYKKYFRDRVIEAYKNQG